MIKIQNFTYHSHNNSQGLFDGQSSADEMIAKAQELGFEAIGVSNHMIMHPNLKKSHTMFFNNPQLALDVYKKMYDEIDETASKYKIKVYKGFEVDYFNSAEWNKWFEKTISKLNYDYLIGASHHICSADEKLVHNIYHLNDIYPAKITSEQLDEYLMGYWKNIIGAIKSGYFDFIAHIDYCTQFTLCTSSKWDDVKLEVIETLSAKKQAFELNTSGITKIGRPFPDWWMIEELIKKQVPIVLSCDSHHTSHIGRHFAEAEKFLLQKNCKQRFKISK